VRGPASAGSLLQEERTRIYLDVSSLPAGEHRFAVEVAEGNRLHFFTPTVSVAAGHETERRGGEHLEFYAEVQNLAEHLVLVDISPKFFTISRGRG